jgi:hypothetical protein
MRKLLVAGNGNTVPKRGNHNFLRTASVGLAVVLGGVACGDSKPRAAVVFETNDQAQARLAGLVNQYGNESNASQREAREINTALKAAIPLFKSDVAEKVGALQRPELQRNSIRSQDVLGNDRSFSFRSFTDKQGVRTDSITLDVTDGHRNERKYLAVSTNTANGETELRYRYDIESDREEFTGWSNFDIGVNNTLEDAGQFDVDGIGQKYSPDGRTFTFHNGFNFRPLADQQQGRNLSAVVSDMQEIYAFLADAQRAAALVPAS